MRKLIVPLAAFMALGLCVQFAQAQSSSESKVHHITGVLVDSHCAAKFADKSNPAKAAADHTAACTMKCAKGGATIVFLTHNKELKLDKHGQELAMAYLSKEDAKTRVRITGTINGDEMHVTNIQTAKPRKAPAAG